MLTITNIPVDVTSDKYKLYDKSIPVFENQAVYVYSFEENRMVYANGWSDILGYNDLEISMHTIVGLTSPRYIKFTNELNNKVLVFFSEERDNLAEYSFTFETEKMHKNGKAIPLFIRVGIYKAKDRKVMEVIGIVECMSSIQRGEVMQYEAHGPEISEFENMLNKEIFCYKVISGKEKEALKLAAKGLSFKEIAFELNVSQSAIEKRIIPLYKRLGVSGLPHLINYAHLNNIL